MEVRQTQLAHGPMLCPGAERSKCSHILHGDVAHVRNGFVFMGGCATFVMYETVSFGAGR